MALYLCRDTHLQLRITSLRILIYEVRIAVVTIMHAVAS